MWIQNVSLADIEKGIHKHTDNGMLIQIVDPDMEFPTPLQNFAKTVQLKFLDLEVNDQYGEDKKITHTQAKELVDALQYAKAHGLDVVVHCHMGVCRSGAVAEIGVSMGFEDTGAWRQPNLMVKDYMSQELGWSYNISEVTT